MSFKPERQREFDKSDFKPETEESEPVINNRIDYERIRCQYCQDVGPCIYCRRGQEFIAEMKKD